MPYDPAKGTWVGPRFSLASGRGVNVFAELSTAYRANAAVAVGQVVAWSLCLQHAIAAALNASGPFPTWVYLPDKRFLVCISAALAVLAACSAAYLRVRQPFWLLLTLIGWAVALITPFAWHVLGHTGISAVEFPLALAALLAVRGGLARRKLAAVDPSLT